MDDVAVADRLLVVSQIGNKFLTDPVWIQPGQRYWYDDEVSALVVEDSAGRRVTYPCAYQTGPDAVR